MARAAGTFLSRAGSDALALLTLGLPGLVRKAPPLGGRFSRRESKHLAVNAPPAISLAKILLNNTFCQFKMTVDLEREAVCFAHTSDVLWSVEGGQREDS